MIGFVCTDNLLSKSSKSDMHITIQDHHKFIFKNDDQCKAGSCSQLTFAFKKNNINFIQIIQVLFLSFYFLQIFEPLFMLFSFKILN